jgi:unsaturated chondroitin disaccharide hydrolase
MNNLRIPTLAELNEAKNRCVQALYRDLPNFTQSFKSAVGVNQFYEPTGNTDWTTGFWTGQLWLAYQITKDEQFKQAALNQVVSFDQRIRGKIEVDHHDMGFLYTLSCTAAYQLTENTMARDAAVLAADNLMARFHPAGKFFQAWGSMNDPKNYRLIIDALLNLPLLYWASEVTGKKEYRERAVEHCTSCLNNVVREDYSTFHTFFFDPITGNPVRGETCQGYRDGSAWARGQAWGIYGTALNYRYTTNPQYLELFPKLAGFYLSKLPQDLVPYWDLDFSDGSDEPRDSSSAAITACGLLEMAEILGNTDQSLEYRNLALQMVGSLIDRYEVKDPEVSNGLLLHGTYSKKSPYNTCDPRGVDEPTIWGDYFFIEALVRLTQSWNSFW